MMIDDKTYRTNIIIPTSRQYWSEEIKYPCGMIVPDGEGMAQGSSRLAGKTAKQEMVFLLWCGMICS